MNAFERLIYNTPYTLLREGTYAWFGVVLFLTLAPGVSLALAIFLGLIYLTLNYQGYLWKRQLRRPNHALLYEELARAPQSQRLRNLALLVAAAGVIGYLLHGSFAMGWGSWLLLVVGFILLQRNHILFGLPTHYIVTETGIGIARLDVKLFLRFDEIAQLRILSGQKEPAPDWTVIAPSRKPQQGILIRPKKIEGFSPSLKVCFISPGSLEAFLRHVPPALVVR